MVEVGFDGRILHKARKLWMTCAGPKEVAMVIGIEPVRVRVGTLSMPYLKENLRSRVSKLAKPANPQQALQPLLEAISNSIMAIEERYNDSSRGKVQVDIDNLGADEVSIDVRDDGVGLDDEHFAAFLVVDTEFKRHRGGKGVGRLFWLDAFARIEVESQYRKEDGSWERRAFRFVLGDDEQVQYIEPTETWVPGASGTIVRFRGLRSLPYISKFPKKAETVTNYVAAEFIAAFLSRTSPQIELRARTSSGNETVATFPDDVANLVVVGPQAVTIADPSRITIDNTVGADATGLLPGNCLLIELEGVS